MVTGCVQPYVPYDRAPKPTVDSFARAADPNPTVRADAAADLAVDPDPRAVQMLKTLLQRDGVPAVRGAAADAIATRRDPDLDPLLVTATETDPDPSVRAQAEAARAKLYPWSKHVGTAAGISIICPGCGEIYLGHTATGAAQIGATATLIASGFILINGHTANLSGPVDSASTAIGFNLLEAGQNSWFYSIFDAYRDARVLRGDGGYKHPITHESLGDLASAPFRPSVLASPWLWAGVPATLALGLGVTYLADRSSFTANPSIFHTHSINVLGHTFGRGGGFAAGEGYYLTLFDPVGVGEESLFRGVIQNELDERFGTWGGLVLGSTIFGAVHTLNFLQPGANIKDALIAVPTIAVLGSALGFAFIKTGYKLETSVAMHFWYDFLLSTAGYIVDPQHQPFVVQVGNSF